MTASETGEGGSPPTRFSLRERFGEPEEWEGSVNDPRTREAHGVRYNERWIYLLPDGSRLEIYFHRYDFRGARKIDPSGSVEEAAV